MNEDLTISYHQQDTDYYCGAACAQMVLDSLGHGLISQADLYTDNHTHSVADAGVNWATAPDGLQWTLNNRQSTKYFCLDALASEDAISRMIVWTIHHYQVAPAALVYGWAHWIIVRGYSASAAPTSSVDTGYSISGFDLNNPWPPTPTPAPPPPHSGADGCGGGGMRGIADEHITYAAWQSTYMTGVPGGHWSGKFVAICDPDPPAGFGPRPSVRQERSPFDGTRLIAAEDAFEIVRRGFREHGLLERDKWKAAFEGRDFDVPQLVERLDHPGNYYYIVPAGSEGTVGAAMVDARFGRYLQSIVVERAKAAILPPIDDVEDLLEGLAGRRFDLPGLDGQLLVRPGLVCVYPHLVWRPCLESFSPYYPFRMITIGSFRLYVRVPDGAVFTSLTTDAKGA